MMVMMIMTIVIKTVVAEVMPYSHITSQCCRGERMVLHLNVGKIIGHNSQTSEENHKLGAHLKWMGGQIMKSIFELFTNCEIEKRR